MPWTQVLELAPVNHLNVAFATCSVSLDKLTPQSLTY